jgi:hypothetical protein
MNRKSAIDLPTARGRVLVVKNRLARGVQAEELCKNRTTRQSIIIND